MGPRSKWFVLLSLLAIAQAARGQAFSGVATSIGGRPIPSAQVTVCAGWSDTLVQNYQQVCNGQAPLVAPSQPTLAAVTGTLPVAGTYGVLVTYVNGTGETVGSAFSSITTSGGSTSIQATSPVSYSNATGWNVYFTTAGETTTFYKQNGAQIPIGTNFTQSVAVATTGAQPPATTTATAAILPLATIFSNVAETNLLTNPFSADSNGRYTFFAAAGQFTVSISAPGYVTYSYPISVLGSSFTSINNVVYADTQPGATADAKLNNCMAALPAGGGTCDARGFGATTQTIAATVNVGSNVGSGKTVTLLIDRTTKFVCTITNNTPCFQKGAGSSIIGQGEVAIPNAGIQFSSSAAISQALFDQQQNGGNFVGGYVEGLTVVPNATMTVSDAFISLQCPLQVTSYRNISFGGPAPAGIGLKIYGTTACGAGNVDFDNVQIDCQGSAGCKPVWIGCASAGSTTLVACSGLGNISFRGKGSSYGHPGTGGLPIIDIECGNGAGGQNPCGGFTFSALQMESRNAGDIGILANGVQSFHIYDLYGTCAVTCGVDLIRISQPAGTVVDGVDVRGVDNQTGWTNTLNNTITGKTFPWTTAPRVNYSYSALSRIENFVDGGPFGFGAVAFANLGTPANGTFTFCNDCVVTNPCTGGGTGAFARRLNGAWACADAGGNSGINQYFTVTGCTTAASTDSNCTGTINLPVAYADNAYFVWLTPNTINGAFLATTVSGTLATNSFPYTLTCTFNCSSIVAPTIYVFTHHN